MNLTHWSAKYWAVKAMLSFMPSQKARHECGFSLIEVAIVLAIVGLVVAGVWASASAVSENRKISQASQQLLQIVQNVRNLYSGQSSIANADVTENLIPAGVFPAEMITGASGIGAVRNVWGGVVQIVGYGSEFSVYLDGMTEKACANLAMATIRNANATGLLRGIINGGSDITEATLSNLECSTGNGNEIVWYYTLK